MLRLASPRTKPKLDTSAWKIARTFASAGHLKKAKSLRLGKASFDKRLRREMKRRLAAHVAARAEHDREVVTDFDPRLIEAFAEFERTSGTHTRDVLYRAADIVDWLCRICPTSIHELGSGRSSLVFSLWAKRHGIPYMAFEQGADWVSMTSAAIESLGGAGRIVHTQTRRLGERGIRFSADIPDDADFIYVDGPIGSPVNFDVSDHLGRGCRPRTILVDGRTQTCEHLASLPEAMNYDVQFQFKVLPQCVNQTEIRRHTSFVLRSA